jgi:putative endonuclease
VQLYPALQHQALGVFRTLWDIRVAIAREKQLKKWSRVKKIRLIVAMNPDWKDLSQEWGKPTEPFAGLR